MVAGERSLKCLVNVKSIPGAHSGLGVRPAQDDSRLKPEDRLLKNEDSDCLKTNYTPQRIVSLQPSATVIIDRLGLLDRVVACTRYCADVCPEAARGRAIVADSWTAQAGEILAAKPDLVIASVPYQEKAVGEILKAGIRFLGFAPRTLADIYGDIAAIAGILGAAERGDEVIGKMQGDIAAVAARVRAARHPHRRQTRRR